MKIGPTGMISSDHCDAVSSNEEAAVVAASYRQYNIRHFVSLELELSLCLRTHRQSPKQDVGQTNPNPWPDHFQ